MGRLVNGQTLGKGGDMYKPVQFCTIFLVAVAALGCNSDSRLTTDPNSPTVQLRDELIKLANGNIDRISGATKEGEGYVLMYGYEGEMEIRQLPISATLCDKLDEIRPPSDIEIYVLAHYKGEEVIEYTEWKSGRDFIHELYETPQLITGNPYAYKVDEKKNLIKLN